MFRLAGEGFRIFCDYEDKVIRVQTNKNPIKDWEPLWEESATFSNPADWEESPFSKRITDSEVQEDIDWFWVDMEVERNIEKNIER